MILMYHDIGYVESTWRRTPENLRKDLTVLHQRGYFPVALTDLVHGQLNVPLGKTPVVITFDDGHPGQFQWEKSDYLPGEPRYPSKQSAVGILTEFYEEHPDFPARATFFLNGTRPFGDKTEVAQKLNYLLDNGMDIGNHLTHHQNLGQKHLQHPLIIQKAIGKQAQFLTKLISHRYPDYAIETLALCYGRRPKSRLQRFLHKGTTQNFTYTNIAVLNVGAGPTYSPFDKRFKPLAMPRIRASETNTYGTGLYNWLKHFDENPNERYVSDGNEKIVTIPKNETKWLNRNLASDLGYIFK